ncbi:MAG: hypothetical protein KAG82_14890, partial [Alcanivoracaceae bacterium]|nr:hypothetical protein [Alcanivoracaceae bacterium]
GSYTTLNGTADGNISQSGALTVSGVTTLTADTNAITATLTDATNDFASVVLATINGGSFSNADVVDASALTIGGSADTLSATAGGALIFSGGGYTTLNGTATGNISRSGNLAVTGTATMTADTNAITLGFGGVGSEFAILDLASVNGGSFSSATVFDPNLITISGDADVLNAIVGTTLTLGGGTYGALNAEILSGSSLNQTGSVIVTGATSIVANVNSITVDLSDAGNDFNTINFTGLTGATFNDVVIVDTTALSVGNLVVGGPGDIDVSADDGLTVTGTMSTNTGDINLNADADAAGAGLLTLAAASSVSSAGNLTLTAADFEFDMPAGDLSAVGTFDLVFTQAGDLCLGLSSGGVGCQINLDNTDISVLTAVGAELELDNSGSAIRAEAADFGGTDLVLLGFTINDENAGTGLDNIGALTLTTTNAIGNLNGGLNIDATSVDVTSSNSSIVNLVGDSAGNTTYTIASAGTVSNLSITETTGDLIIAGSDTTGTTTLVASAGKVDIDGAVTSGGVVAMTGSAGIDLGADVTTTADNVNLNSAVILTADAAINTGAGIGDITVVGTIDSDAGNTWALDLTADTGSIDLQSDVGATDALASLTVNSATVATFAGNVTTTGVQDVTADTIELTGSHSTTNSDILLTGDVLLQGGVSLSSGAGDGDVIVTGTIDNPHTLTVLAGTGNIDLQGDIGTTPLASLEIISATTARLGGDVTTTDFQVYNPGTLQTNGTLSAGFNHIRIFGDLELQADTDFTTISPGIDILVAGTIDSDAGNTWALDLTAGTGNIDLQSDVGATDALASLTVNSATAATFGGNVTTTGVQDVTATTINTNGTHTTTASDILLTGNVILEAATALTTGAGAGNITVTGTIDSDAGNTWALDLTADTGSIDLQSDVGATDALASLTINSATNVDLVAVTAGSVTQLAGTGTTTVAGAMNANTGDISITTDRIVQDADMTATGNVLLNAAADIELNEGVLTANDRLIHLIAGAGVQQNFDTLPTHGGLVASELLLEGTGDFNLLTTGVNQVGTVAGNVNGTVAFTNSQALIIGSVTDLLANTTDGLTAETLLVLTEIGDLTVTNAATATDGNLLLDAAGNLQIDNVVTATTTGATGNASLLAGGSITQSETGDVNVDGNLDVEAGTTITMADDGADSAVSTAGGNIRYLAAGDISLGGLSGVNVRVESTGGSIIDNGDSAADVTATNLQLVANQNVGAAGAGALDVDVDTLAASAANGNIYISEADGLNLTTVADFNVTRIGLDSSATPTAVGALSNVLAANNLKIEALLGDLTVTDTVTATDGDLLLDVAGNLQIDNVVTATTTTTTGNASLLAGGSITQSETGDVNVDGSLDVEAGTTITMVDDGADGAVSTAGGNIRYLATGDIRLASLNGANVLVQTTGGSIIDNGETDVDLIGASVQLRALNSIGEPDGTNNGLLETTAGTFNALASNGGIYIDETDALVIDETVAVIDVLRVNIDSTTSNQAGTSVLFGAFAGTDVIVRADTDLTVANNGAPVAGVFASAGNVLLRAETGNLQINDAVRASAGDVTLQAPAGTIGQGVEGDVTAGGDVFAQANGTITMADGAVSQATNNVFYGSAADLRIGSLTGADVLIDVGGSIIDNGDAHVDVVATNAQLRAGTSIGEADGTNNGPLETTVTTLAASAGTGNIYLTETDALVIGPVAAIDVDSVGLNATSSVNAGSALAGAVAAQNLKIEAVAGGITVDSAVEATAADLLLDAQGGDLAINATVDAGGNASLLASANVTQSATGDVTVGGTLDVNAQGGDITMTDGAISAATGNLRYLATGDIRLASLNGANVLVNAGGSIIDNGETDVDVIATNAQLIAGTSIGEADGSNNGPIETTVATLAASAGTGNIYLSETDNLTIGSV